jgi:hypothetical protein
MRIFLFAALLAGALWYGFVGARRIDEVDVYNAYNKYWNAFSDGDSKAVCGMYDGKYFAKTTTRTPAGPVEESADKAQACRGTDSFYAMKKDLEEKAKVEMFVNVRYDIGEIEISADRKTAIVRLTTEIKLGTEQRLYLKISSVQTDTVIRDLGRTRFKSSESLVSLY